MRFVRRSFVPMVEVLSPVQHGTARIERFTVISQEYRPSTRYPTESIPPGDYCRLVVNDAVVMADTPVERNSSQVVLEHAKGDVLLAGLGLGMVLPPLLLSDDVASITVVERNPDVIAAVMPSFSVSSAYWLNTLKAYRLHRLSVINADIFTWRPTGSIYDFIYFDVWADRHPEHLKEIGTLRSRFRRNMRHPHGTVGMFFWSEFEMRQAAASRLDRW